MPAPRLVTIAATALRDYAFLNAEDRIACVQELARRAGITPPPTRAETTTALERAAAAPRAA